MSLNHSPSVVTNGLVLYTDMSNTQKSWKGAPTTNLLSITDWNTNFNGTSPYWDTMTRTAITTDLLYSGVYIGKGVTAGAGGYGFGYIDFSLPTGATAGIVYACSFWYKSTGRTAYVWCHDTAGLNTAYSSTLPANGTWTRGVSLFTSTTSGTVRLHIHTNAGAVGDIVYVTALMIEQQSFGTPFVNGTRTNTQAIVDLTGNVTITANSLTYASDNTFSFNGSSDYITIPSNQLALTLWTQPWTLGVWMYVPASATWSDGANRSHFVSKGSTAGIWGIIRGITDNTIYAAIRTDAGIYQATGGSITRDAWCNVVGTWDGVSTVSTYINGVLVGSATAATLSGVPDTSNLFVGRSVNTVAGSPGLFYNGKVSNVVGYTRALTAAEVNQNFNALRGRYSL